MTHYETLGVASDATHAQIKAAYRRLASQHHPDREGGDKDKAAAVNDAYACLSDTERRRRYDESGQDGHTGPSPEEQRRIEIQTALLSALKAAIAHDDVEELGLIALTRGRLEGAINQAQGQSKEIAKAIGRLERLKKRTRRKADGADDLVQMMLDGQLQDLQRALAAAKDADQTMGEALKLLEVYEEDTIEPQIRPRKRVEQDLLASMISQHFGTSGYRF